MSDTVQPPLNELEERTEFQRYRMAFTTLLGLFARKRKFRINALMLLNLQLDRLSTSNRWMVRPFRPISVWLAARTAEWWFKESVARFRQDQPPSRQVLEGPVYDCVFFLPDKSQGWILEGICKDIAREFPGTHTIHYSYRHLPRARVYFLAHYSQLYQLAFFSPHVLDGKTIAFFTHPRHDMQFPMGLSARILNGANYVFTMNHWSKGYLRAQGVRREKLVSIHGAADPKLFTPHVRTGQGKVGFCTGFYERKRPELILDLVRRLPHRSFILLGKNWKAWSRFEELTSLANFEYVETSYAQYPSYYAQMDVFVSPAILEGGPIPLIESMMCNVVPVASHTGFAPDLIRHGKNGFLFDPAAEVEVVAQLVEEAFQLPTDVRAGIEHFTWKRFGEQIKRVMEDLPPVEASPDI